MVYICQDHIQPFALDPISFCIRTGGVKKNAQQAFDVLQSSFTIFTYPALTWSKKQMCEAMMACLILHTMIIESECVDPADDDHPYYHQIPLAQVDHAFSEYFATFLTINTEIRDEGADEKLQNDLVAHLWALTILIDCLINLI